MTHAVATRTITITESEWDDVKKKSREPGFAVRYEKYRLENQTHLTALSQTSRDWFSAWL